MERIKKREPRMNLDKFNLYSFVSAIDEKAMTILKAVFENQPQIYDPTLLVMVVLNTFHYNKAKCHDVLLTTHMMRLFQRAIHNKRDNEKFITWQDFNDVLIRETMVLDRRKITEAAKETKPTLVNQLSNDRQRVYGGSSNGGQLRGSERTSFE